jgi:DNA-binding SARP family transcriptional activator/tetratricopeptide (TPR) repeat protein
MSSLQMALLGQPEFKLNGRNITDDLARKGQALIAYLAVTRQGHSREALAGLLWSEMDEESARRNLRVTLTKLRPFFDDCLVIQRRTLAFNLESDYWLDVDVFESCLQGSEQSLAQLRTAADLYRGPFLDDLPLTTAPGFEEWLQPYQERLRQMAMDALYRLAVHFTQERRYAAGIDYLGRLLTLEPWMEEAHRQLMLLLTLSGQRSAALAQYELCCAMLDEELGVEPSQPTVDLYQRILQEKIEEEQEESLIMQTAEPAFKWSPPFQAPAPSRYFVGREALCQRVAAALTTEPATIQAVVGMGGVGKTTTAVQIAHLVQAQFEDGVLWANATTSDPKAILESWARLYGYEFEQIQDLPALASAFRGVLVDKRALIVLDDVTSMTRIRPLLPGSDTVPVLLTTRDHDLAHALNARIWPLQPLSLTNGRLLLTQILGQERIKAESEAADQICALLQNLPLAVEIVGQRLKSRTRRRLADVAARLSDETRRLSELKISDQEVRASFALSYDSLDADLRYTFALMGLFAGRSFTAAALTAAADQDRYEVEDRIFTLISLSLAQEEGETRYSQHPLLADFAREKLGEAVEEHGRLIQYYLDFVRQYQQDYDNLRPEWDNILGAMQTAYAYQIWPAVIDFADALGDAWFTRGRYTDARKGYMLAAEAAVATNDPLKQASFLYRWGQACIEQADHAAAHDKFTQSQRLCQEIGDIAGLANTETSLGRLALERGEVDEAKTHLAHSRHLYESLNDNRGLAKLSHTEARLHYFMGDYTQAATLAEQAIVHWEQLADERNAAITLDLLAATALEQRLPDLAEQYARRSLVLAERLQAKGEQAVALGTLAHIHRMRRDFDQAQAAAERGLALLETIGDLSAQANALYLLSRIYLESGQYESAIQFGQKSLHLCQTVQYRLLEVYVLNCLGDVYRQLKQADQAHSLWLNALDIAKALQNPTAIRATEARLAAHQASLSA